MHFYEKVFPHPAFNHSLTQGQNTSPARVRCLEGVRIAAVRSTDRTGSLEGTDPEPSGEGARPS